jgi:hypothetical protein
VATMVSCAICAVERLAAAMRYNKCKLTGEWEYQCSDCRQKIKRGELEH